jgi:hypothetical protein
MMNISGGAEACLDNTEHPNNRFNIIQSKVSCSLVKTGLSLALKN